MDTLSLRITDHALGFDQTIQISQLSSPPASEIINNITVTDTAPPNSGWTKVLADGTRIQGNDPRTDHVAVIDHARGLMFAVESIGDADDEDGGISQADCIERCKALRLLNHDDWRLPTRSELAGLIDDTRHEPAIDTNLFPRVKPRWHWTSTPCAWSAASAWSVDFGSGFVSNDHRSYSGFALAVRRAGQ